MCQQCVLSPQHPVRYLRLTDIEMEHRPVSPSRLLNVIQHLASVTSPPSPLLQHRSDVNAI